ncbi:Maltase-glucoamylase, intestinal [Araneus ventricosus]|uniref:Maltase-glucoamylase, intestinal n=1 Tax=Araneus ventricosus TaxID=182803 RepID=A0A4Y2TK01_ARAVE|nr:Maltase-glucoamylase, intestinal [Araneus ventricosus]
MLLFIGCQGGLVVRSRLRKRRVPCSKPDFTEEPSCLWAWCALNLMWIKRSPPKEARKLGEEVKESGSERLSKLTLCMESFQDNGAISYRHYDVHSLYGWSQTQPTLEAAEKATGYRLLVITSSTYPSSGRNADHWLGDNRSLWDDLRRSIISQYILSSALLM